MSQFIIQSPTPFIAVCVGLVAAVLIKLSEGNPNAREFWTIAASFIKFLVVASMLPTVLNGGVLGFTLITMIPGIEIAFKVDALGIFFALMASFLWIVTSFYSISYIRAEKEHKQTRYYMSFAIALSATMGLAFSANLLTMFIFYEIITLCTFPLVGHKETPEAMAGARKYLTYLLGTSLLFMMFAIVLTYSAAGTLDFSDQGILNGNVSKTMAIAIFILFMAGTAKAGMMPFHSWLPAAMVAPTPVSALLHAVAVVKAGVFVVIKIVLHVFGISLLANIGLGTALAYFASFTIIVASMIALRQDNLKARLAYSTISQLSYIVLGVALLSPSGITGSVMHMVLHGFGKITLFFTAGAIYVATHKTKVSQLDGIGRKMPFTMVAFTIGALSMIGIPPLGGFVSKFFLVKGSIEAGLEPLLFVLAISALLNAGYFLPVIYRAFFKAPVDDSADNTKNDGIKEAPVMMVIPILITAAGAVILFFKPSVFLELARLVVKGASGGGF
jgi:multicomponent Na+:H+ antiporter subunit D